MKTHCTAHWLVVIGGLNWGLYGLGMFFGSNWNVVNLLLGSWPTLEWLVYVIIGLSALYIAATHKKHCATCRAQ